MLMYYILFYCILLYSICILRYSLYSKFTPAFTACSTEPRHQALLQLEAQSGHLLQASPQKRAAKRS